VRYSLQGHGIDNKIIPITIKENIIVTFLEEETIFVGCLPE
jgi:hypothetical protein